MLSPPAGGAGARRGRGGGQAGGVYGGQAGGGIHRVFGFQTNSNIIL